MTDTELLAAVLAMEDLDDARRVRFEDMALRLRRYGRLTVDQRAWAAATLAREHYEPPVSYENLFSRGLVPRGREVTVNIGMAPKRPPGRGT